ncbi:CsbD family protein [Terrilactibacillus laevilacticus]|uniref:CsbD family protein n=1 Tax=Terrilactibacillus laevilacticus TaxID=1380157 RepID=A0ABW5PU37_9BACI|nr:CsbD family protein [Terrilactibacillus laevilacticus]
MSTKDKVKAAYTKVKGEVKEKAGYYTDNAETEAEGKKDKIKAKVQENVNEAKDLRDDFEKKFNKH